jgi:Na+/phosphate symporter
MELGHMSKIANNMLGQLKSAFEARDIGELAQQFDRIVVLREAVLAYLQQIGRNELSDIEAEEYARLVTATGEIESMSAAISRELSPLAEGLEATDIVSSKETTELLDRLLKTIQETAQSALGALVELDEQAAQSVVAKRAAILKLSADLQRLQAAVLAQDDPNSLMKHRLLLDLLDKLRRIYSVSEHMAISVLPRSILSGDLYQ